MFVTKQARLFISEENMEQALNHLNQFTDRVVVDFSGARDDYFVILAGFYNREDLLAWDTAMIDLYYEVPDPNLSTQGGGPDGS